MRVVEAVLVLLAVASCANAQGTRGDWYRNSLVNIHIDNHSGPVGMGVPVEELVAGFRNVPVGMIQVSAQSNGYATYPTKVGMVSPDWGSYDTLATWKEVTRRLGVKMCVYMSVDRRPLQVKLHPEWAMRDAKGEISVNGDPCICNRPNREKKGYLYEQFLPQIKEIIARYDPEGLWFDGDYILTKPCWCDNCLREWQADTGQEAPRDESSPLWGKWCDWHYQRFQEYRRLVAETIHQASPKAMYTTNWSFAWTPEQVPDWADNFSGDTGSIRQVFPVVMRWGAQRTPWDIMTYAIPASRTLSRTYSPQRILQEGALAMAYGGNWFAWTFGGDVPPAGVDQARHMAESVRDRQPALGPSQSLSQVAVLDSETTWWATGRQRSPSVENAARTLQEAHYFTDIVNEKTLRAGLVPYRVVVVPAGNMMAPETMKWLDGFVHTGGKLIVCSDGLPDDQMLGLKRKARTADKPVALKIGDQRAWTVGSWDVELGTAKALLNFDDGRPAVTLNALGAGQVAYLATDQVLYPQDAMLPAALRALDCGASYVVSGSGAAPVLCNLRARALGAKGKQIVLHLVDCSSRLRGRYGDINTEDFTDDNPYLRNVKVQIPCQGKLRLVQAVPALTGAQVTCENGMLTASVSYLQNHAALILGYDEPPVFALHAAAAPASTGDFHPLDPQSTGFAEDFESVVVGAQPPLPWRSYNKDNATVAVANETSAGGSRSVKFTDTEGSSFYPFMHRSVTPFQQGRARLDFDVRVDGAECLMEVRYEGKGAGPAVRFGADGKLSASGKELGTFPLSQWIHAQVDFTLGMDKPSYTLTVTAPGQAPQVFKDLPYATEWFFLCDSVYFVGSGEKAGSFCLDNVRFERL